MKNEKKEILVAGWLFFLYGFLGIFVTVLALIMQSFGTPLLNNFTFYSRLSDNVFGRNEIAGFLFCVVWALFLMLAGMGVIRHKLWGFSLSTIIAIITILVAIAMMPWGIFDIIVSALLLILLHVSVLDNVPLPSSIFGNSENEKQ